MIPTVNPAEPPAGTVAIPLTGSTSTNGGSVVTTEMTRSSVPELDAVMAAEDNLAAAEAAFADLLRERLALTPDLIRIIVSHHRTIVDDPALVAWSETMAGAKARAADEGRLLLTYVFSPG